MTAAAPDAILGAIASTHKKAGRMTELAAGVDDPESIDPDREAADNLVHEAGG
mgnify:CR=1 FL=1